MEAPLLPPGASRLEAGDYDLLDRARRASERAWAPLSHLHVGAAVRWAGESGEFVGCNVEDLSQAGTVHAEQAALAGAILNRTSTSTSTARLLTHVAVFAFEAKTNRVASASPCGACRQLLLQFNPEARVLFTVGDDVVDSRLTELLPHPFELPRT